MLMLDDPGLGLSIGFEDSLGALQLLGCMLSSSRSLQEAFDLCKRFSSLMVDGMDLELVHTGTLSRLRFSFSACQEPEALRFGEDLTTALIWRLNTHTLISNPSLRLRQPEPAYRQRMDDLFGCPIAFDCEHSEVMFERSVLGMHLPFADSRLVSTLAQDAERLLSEVGQDRSFANRVQLVLANEAILHDVDMYSIADRLGVSPRVLRRRLHREGTTLRALLDDYRRDQAVERLRLPNAAVKEVAEALGYSEPSAFHRAFKRWTGVPPAEYAKLGPDVGRA
jgi:AraC-like DNA-binding protein